MSPAMTQETLAQALQRQRQAEDENAALRRQLAELGAKVDSLQHPRSPEETDQLARLQARADNVCGMLGERAPEPMPGEAPAGYRVRILQRLQRHSNFAKTDLARLDAAMLDAIEPEIYRAAEAAARSGAATSPGVLIPHVTIDRSGRQITTFTGDILSWMSPMMSGPQVVEIRRPKHQPRSGGA